MATTTRSKPRSASRASARPAASGTRSTVGSDAKRTVLGAIRELPNFVRLLYGLMTDGRVAAVDKLLVAGAVAYVLMPMDLIPDFIPFIGEVDDVFVMVLALRHLMKNAGRTIMLDHWMGEPDELEDLNLQRVLAAAAFFLPRRLRRRLRTIGRV